jgi:hypothetical protein
LSIRSGAGGTGSGSTIVDVEDNKGNARTGTLSVAGQTVTVTQARK